MTETKLTMMKSIIFQKTRQQSKLNSKVSSMSERNVVNEALEAADKMAAIPACSTR
jgi:hypothetical protein